MNKAILLTAAIFLGSTMLGMNRADAAGACSQVYSPVCALKKDGTRQTYTNAGCAGIDGAKVLHKDGCSWFACVPGHTVCAIDPATKKPTTYNSLCSAEFYNATVVGERMCK
jgi:hypothetical protein